MTNSKNRYSNAYLAGLGVGLSLFASYFLLGSGLGASGTTMSLLTEIERLIVPSHVEASKFLMKQERLFEFWMFYLILGVAAGGFISGKLAGRVKLETNRGPNITDRQRWMFALIGGIFFGFGAKLARGCASGLIMTGGASLSVGAWAAMIVWMATAFLVAYFVRRLWI